MRDVVLAIFHGEDGGANAPFVDLPIDPACIRAGVGIGTLALAAILVALMQGTSSTGKCLLTIGAFTCFSIALATGAPILGQALSTLVDGSQVAGLFEVMRAKFVHGLSIERSLEMLERESVLEDGD